MIATLCLAIRTSGSPTPAFGAARLPYAVPIITSVSLVYAATRHEAMGPILIHALQFAIWIVVFMVIVFAVIQFLTWMQ